MALSITQAGTGNSTTSGTTFSVTPTVSFAVNDTVVVCSAHDNRVTGSPYISSVTDSQGNTYSLAAGNKTQGGTSADRATVAIYWCNVTVALSTSDTITITFNGSLAAKAVVLYKISAASNKKASLRLAAAATPLPATTNFSGGSPTMVNGEALVRALAIEDSQTVTGDSDTTRGSWSAAYSDTALGASATTSMQIFTQTKIVTGNGTQTWDVTFTSADTATAYGIFEEVAALAVLSRTASGSGVGSAVAATKVIQFRLGIHTDFTFGFTNGAGRFYIGPPTVTRTATGSGTGAGSATRKIIVVRTATGSGTGTSNNAIVVGRLRTGYGSGGATAGDTATILVIKVRTATGSGAGASSVIYLEKLARTATASGSSTSAIVVLHVAPRTATSGGTGSSSSTRILIAFRTGTGAGTGTQASVGARALRRTCTGSGSGASTNVNWEKSHIFRVPITEGYPFAERLSEEAPDRLFAHTPQGARAKNLYRLTDGTYTTTDPRRPELISRAYYGGHDIFLTDDEVTELTAAGYGASIT